MDHRLYAFFLHDAVKRQKAFLQRPDHIHRLRMQLLGGRGHTVLEQLLRQILQRLCPVADLRKVTPDRFAVFLLLQKIQIADERRERRSQVMGKAGNGLLQFQVPLLTAPALFAEQTELEIDIRSKPPHIRVPGGN